MYSLTNLANSNRDYFQYGGFFDPTQLEAELQAIEKEMTDPGFWQSSEKSEKAISKSKELKAKLSDYYTILNRFKDLEALFDLLKESGDVSLLEELEREIKNYSDLLDSVEVKLILSDPLDQKNAILSIHAGAGGTEACDWAAMLLRMYQRYAERHGYKVSLVDILPGEEAGIKSASILVSGNYAYGYLKAERGVHRLVRISPFNAQGKRQTSFASVDVVAEVDETIDIEIKESDLKIDVFRSSGHGGQGVNTTDSAVRITHLPTGLVVVCQNERSQLQNRATALKILRSRLYELEKDKKRAEMERIYGQKGEIGWGRQIRSYVLQPYKMVKDLRTGESRSQVEEVLDGDLDSFIWAYLLGKKKGQEEREIEET
ncbi:peptide chain release factor 2 [Candidatus Methylacidiphilum fumarolicum]|nr:peptide chain release factor 2 [Candidatus Methylacidiphilum fumarolicum]MBW6415904.1 peptide chain release factor 2 [Candidatus Methylacidiphilum fumarolicum]TFE72538.1 peptide chain release factor 2 [Candidatus Methylacidiphilum fumarolicum]TFE74349.1 peptide chain release factor 2 [Candidatus Methylacidiphilum fumarolicum]